MENNKMIIQIKDYIGNNLLILTYNQILLKGTKNEFNLIDEIVQVNNYILIDLEKNKNNSLFYIVQADEKYMDKNKTKKNLLNLINRLNQQFL